MYTFETWLAFKQDRKLTNKAIAEIIGTSEQNVKMMVTKDKPLPSWARAFIYTWNQVKK